MCIANSTPQSKTGPTSTEDPPSPSSAAAAVKGRNESHPVLTGSLTPPEGVSVLNFSPGPTSLPQDVQEKVKDLFSEGAPLCSMYTSHRSPEFLKILNNTRDLTRKIMDIPDNYSILFTHGGGHGQFAAVPMNLCKTKEVKATYLVSGTWSKRAAVEAAKYCQPLVFSSENEDGSFTSFPSTQDVQIDPDSKYVYLCSNETVNGIEVHSLPKGLKAPLVVDASSDFSTKPIDWEGCNVGILYACASKNIGHPGITMTVVRNDLLDSATDICPGVFHYKTNVESYNLWNTIPTFNVEVVGIVMDWIRRMGGIETMEEWSITKSKMIYDVVDNSNGFYTTPIADEKIRSRMNVPFAVADGDNDLTNDFLIQGWERGIVGLRTLTPFGVNKNLRASLYNGVSIEDTLILKQFMEEYAQANAHKLER